MTKQEIFDLMDKEEKEPSPELFKEILEGAFVLLNLSEYDNIIKMANFLGVSISTVKRWANGRCCPHACMRKFPYHYIRDALSEKDHI